MQLAYLYSRYPVISQTFCDMEMLELERRGYDLLIGAVHPPLTSLRHEHIGRFRSPVHYAPPASVMALWEEKARASERWPKALIKRHERKYGQAFKAALRARNAFYFADFFTRHGVRHFHVHFANRAAHTALFVKEISGIPFSITAHGQDFMSDLGQDDLLREICQAAEFVAVETDYSRGLLRERCPDAAEKIHRVYNGLDLANLPAPPQGERPPGPTTILSVGRLVSFKGFEFLLEACAELDRRNFDFRCQIVGDGPLREKLETMIADLKLAAPGRALWLTLARGCLFEAAQLRYFRLGQRGRHGGRERCLPDRDHGGDGLRETRCLNHAGWHPGIRRRRRDWLADPSRGLGSSG